MYGFLIGFTAILSILFAEKLIKGLKIDISTNEFWNLIIVIFIVSIAGGRAYHVIDNWEFYSQNILNVFYLWQGGLGIFGSVFFILLFLYLYSKIFNKKMLIYTDLLCFFVPFLIISGRIGNYFNNELKQGFFEIIVMLLMSVSLVLNYKKIHFGKGVITYLFLIIYGIVRIIIEPFRNAENSFILYSINLTYVFSVFLIFVGFGIMYFTDKKNQKF